QRMQDRRRKNVAAGACSLFRAQLKQQRRNRNDDQSWNQIGDENREQTRRPEQLVKDRDAHENHVRECQQVGFEDRRVAVVAQNESIYEQNCEKRDDESDEENQRYFVVQQVDAGSRQDAPPNNKDGNNHLRTSLVSSARSATLNDLRPPRYPRNTTRATGTRVVRIV